MLRIGLDNCDNTSASPSWPEPVMIDARSSISAVDCIPLVPAYFLVEVGGLRRVGPDTFGYNVNSDSPAPQPGRTAECRQLLRLACCVRIVFELAGEESRRPNSGWTKSSTLIRRKLAVSLFLAPRVGLPSMTNLQHARLTVNVITLSSFFFLAGNRWPRQPLHWPISPLVLGAIPIDIVGNHIGRFLDLFDDFSPWPPSAYSRT